MLREEQLILLKNILLMENDNFTQIIHEFLNNFKEEEYLSIFFALKILTENFHVQKDSEILISLFLSFKLTKLKNDFVQIPNLYSSKILENSLFHSFVELMKKNLLNVFL
jgi:hypothetical protein